MKKSTAFKVFIFALTIPLLAACNNESEESGGLSENKLYTIAPSDSISTVTGIGMVEPEGRIIRLTMETSGRITQIESEAGSNVKAGEVILVLEKVNDELNLKELKSRKQTLSFSINQSEAAVKEIETRLAYANKNLSEERSLLDKGAVTKKSVEDQEFDVHILELQLAQNKANVKRNKAQLEELNISIQKAEKKLSDNFLRAPADGVVLQIFKPLYSSVNAFEEIVEFAPDGPVQVRCEIDEMFAGYIESGQEAEFRNVGFNKVIATGKVVRALPYLKKKSLFSDSPDDKQDRRVREVLVRLNDPSQLFLNARVECTIHIK